MPFPSIALTSTQRNKIRQDKYKVRQYISLCPNTVVQTAQISTVTTGVNNYAQITLAATVDADVEIGMTVIISRDAVMSAGVDVVGIFRVRQVPSGTTLYINETNTPLNGATFYAHILDDYRIQPKIGRISGANYYKDYDYAFGKPRPQINNLQSAYAGFIDASDVLTISFTPSAYPIASGATITTWAWDVGDGTITSGTASSQNITAEFPEGFRWVTLVATDSNSRAVWRRIPVWAHGSTFTPATGFNGATISGDWGNGYSASISGFDGIDSYLDETLCVIWRQEWYGDTEENIVNNIDFVGRLRNEAIRTGGDLEHGVLIQDTEFAIEGPGQQLQRIIGPVIATYDATSITPTQWDHIYINTPGRTLHHILREHSTFCELHDFSWSDHFGDDYQTLAIGTSQNDILAVVNDICDSCAKGGLEFSPDGSSRAVHDARVKQPSDTTALIYFASMADQDALSIVLNIDHVKQYAKVDASGGRYNVSARTISPVIMTLPGAIGTSGYGVGQLHRQFMKVSTGSFYLQWMAQKYLDLVLNARFTMSLQLPDGYHFLIPSRNIAYQMSLSGDTNARGFEIVGGYWLMTSISIQQDNELGAREVVAEFTELSVRKDDAPEPPDPVFSEDAPQLPFDPISVEQDGNTVVVWGTDGVSLATEYKITATPVWYDLTPDPNGETPLEANETVVQCAWSWNTPRLYMLTYDSSGVQSRVWYKENGANLYEAFTPGAWVTGEYTILRTTHEDGHLYIYAPNVSTNAVTRFSDDSGQTFATAQTVGTGVTNVSAFDTIKIGNTTLAGYNGNSVGISTTEGGTYSNYSTPGNYVRSIYIPRYVFGSTSSDNINTSTPEYLVGKNDGAGARVLYKVTNSGATLTDISPSDSFPRIGTPANPNAIVMPWITGYRIAGFFDHGSGANGSLSTTNNAGSSWTVTELGSVTGYYLRMRRTDHTAAELYWTNNSVPRFSSDFGVTWEFRSVPRGTNPKGIEVYG